MSSIYDTIARCAAAGDESDFIRFSNKVSKVDDYGRVSSVTLSFIFELPFVFVRLGCVCLCLYLCIGLRVFSCVFWGGGVMIAHACLCSRNCQCIDSMSYDAHCLTHAQLSSGGLVCFQGMDCH
jgi:hypothetical protein